MGVQLLQILYIHLRWKKLQLTSHACYMDVVYEDIPFCVAMYRFAHLTD